MQKILVVDDQADIRRLISLTLGKSFDIIEAENGAQALERIRDERPAAVILDVMMPGGLDGFQVLEFIKNDPALKTIKVVMVTAKGQACDLELANSTGADGYLVKPFSPLQLVGLLREKLAA